MGQRSQTFIRINNPMKKEKYVANLSDNDITIGKKVFGEGDTTILPFHHQWLFGLSFVGIAHKILSECSKNYSNRYHPFSPRFDFLGYPKNYLSGEKNFFAKIRLQHTIDMVLHYISFLDNKDIADITGRFGFERFIYLGTEHFDEEGNQDSSPTMSEDCTGGDNNDGILIVDTIKQKYAFVNIHTFEYDTENEGIYSLEPMKPYSAKEYTRAYYPEEGDLEAVLFAKDLMKYYDVLSLEELAEIFPKNFATT